jgi:DNA (cytosine-5)-methyltransferase 1
MRFIDVFAGCGGLSLGLLKAGWKGVAAIEKNVMAFETLRHNLIDGSRYSFDWPTWLPKAAMSCEEFQGKFAPHIKSLSGTIDLMVGGPPCQGFSNAGRRNPDDPRNRMAEQYLGLVKLIMPKYIVIENVSGFNSPFAKALNLSTASETELNSKLTYADYICESLEELGYHVSRGKVNCADFGVPQNRYRYLIMCSLHGSSSLFEELCESSVRFKIIKGLPFNKPTTAHEAIGDLELKSKSLIENMDSGLKNFKEIKYSAPNILTPYLKLMREGYVGPPNSMRLPNHKSKTIEQFQRIMEISRAGKSLPKAARDQLGLKKHAITVLDKNLPTPTITTLPDDIIHYSEPRILTARENARLQSFPDWFEFTGKYTTGGQSRKVDCPRYTQIGNAVPPLLSEAIGNLLRAVKASLPHEKILDTINE